eukprot:TRINITY_DN62175_c0_g1_i1.p1 TRINITY_DN62175_c0_g1~~TRINITY_DN62175_c0_g1_i1.p1  ORF type:complete len:530 (-),score=93.28 TRINITY_DN62175_c0_g1_i1:200-1789(-)
MESLRSSAMQSLCLASLLVAATLGAGIDSTRWYGRSVYFVVTDRFAKSADADDASGPCEGKEWCGGTFRGVTRKLDYIQGMGFDAIWITPIVKQVDWRDNWNGTGYHGYWAADFFSIDPHLGTEDDLLALKRACEKRGMLLMVDIVANHVGPIHSMDQVRQLGEGLNAPSMEQFHTLGRRADQSLASYIEHPVTMQDAGECWPDYNFAGGCNYSVILDGWFGDLADLRQEDAKTHDYLLRWVQWLVEKYEVDGFRLDTALYIPKWFLEKFQEAAGRYMVGEVVTYNFTVHRSFADALTGILNFPVTEHTKRIFSENGSMSDLQGLLATSATMGYPDPHLLGNFIDNHDNERFLHNHSGDVSQLKNGLTWTLLYHGLPIVYYGTEQVEVSNAADNRRSMWPHYGSTELYSFLAQLNKVRRDSGLGPGGQYVQTHAKVVTSTKKCLAFVRGDILAVLTNAGKGGQSCRLCFAPAALPAPWSEACKRGSDVPTAVIGDVPRSACSERSLCVESGKDGTPAVFTLPALKTLFT